MSETRPHSDPAIPGSVLGSYRILGEISSGGMGAVFRGEHILLGRPAAVKLLRPDLTTSASLVQRFVNEAKAVTACKHPGIVEVYDFGYTPDGHAFIVMELLEGEPLGRRLAHRRLAELEVAAIAHGIASALKAAHKVGVIHRDLKPDNVFLVPDPDGGPDRPKVLDFGIAKLADPSPTRTRHTQTGVLIGTPLYMAPEQAREAAAIDHRADLYSLGCIIYHMLVGRPPFVADGGGEIIALQMFGQVVPPSHLMAVTPEMDRLVLRLLEKDPADRFASAAEVAAALAAIAARLANRSSWPGVTGSEAAQPTPVPGAPASRQEALTEATPRKRSGRLAASAITLAVVGGALLAYALMRGDGSVRATPVAGPPAAAQLPPAAPAPVAPAAVPAAPPAPAAVAPVESSSAPAAPDGPRGREQVAPSRHAKPGSTRGATPGKPAGIDAPDRAIEVIREVRPGEPPKTGPYTDKGSPIEVDLDSGRKQPRNAP